MRRGESERARGPRGVGSLRRGEGIATFALLERRGDGIRCLRKGIRRDGAVGSDGGDDGGAGGDGDRVVGPCFKSGDGKLIGGGDCGRGKEGWILFVSGKDDGSGNSSSSLGCPA